MAHMMGTNLTGAQTVAIPELKNCGGTLRGQEKSRGAKINVHLAW